MSERIPRVHEIVIAEDVCRDFDTGQPVVQRRAQIIVTVRRTDVDPARYTCSLTFDGAVLESIGVTKLAELIARQIEKGITKTQEM